MFPESPLKNNQAKGHITSDIIVAEGDYVISYNTITGTHQGEFFGIPATGNSFTITNADICRFNEQGLIAEHWGLLDMKGMLEQLGVLPPPGG